MAPANEAQIGLLVGEVSREKGWKILNQAREAELRPKLRVRSTLVVNRYSESIPFL